MRLGPEEEKVVDLARAGKGLPPLFETARGTELAPAAEEVLDHVLAELEEARQRGQSVSETDFANDVVDRLARVYGVSTPREW